jgi:actin-related protein
LKSGASLAADVSTVVEGQTYQPSARRIEFGGADLNVYLAELLQKRGMSVADPDLLEPVKEACMRVVEKASDLEEELAQVRVSFLSCVQKVIQNTN